MVVVARIYESRWLPVNKIDKIYIIRHKPPFNTPELINGTPKGKLDENEINLTDLN